MDCNCYKGYEWFVKGVIIYWLGWPWSTRSSKYYRIWFLRGIRKTKPTGYKSLPWIPPIFYCRNPQRVFKTVFQDVAKNIYLICFQVVLLFIHRFYSWYPSFSWFYQNMLLLIHISVFMKLGFYEQLYDIIWYDMIFYDLYTDLYDIICVLHPFHALGPNLKLSFFVLFCIIPWGGRWENRYRRCGVIMFPIYHGVHIFWMVHQMFIILFPTKMI